MKLVALMPVRNEDWVLGLSLRVALMWCDSAVVLLHECTDGSGDIVEQVIRDNERGRVSVLRESGRWDEMRHRQNMLVEARRIGATHIAIVDADEVLSGNVFKSRGFREAFDAMSPRSKSLTMPIYNLRGSRARYHANGVWAARATCMGFADAPGVSWSAHGDTFHRRGPCGVDPAPPCTRLNSGGILHLWGVSERRLRAKHALYKLTERLYWPDRSSAGIEQTYNWAIYGDTAPRYMHFGTPATWTYADVPAEWWEPYLPLLKYLNADAEPWQEAECRRLLAEHPGIGRGLDLFGVA